MDTKLVKRIADVLISVVLKIEERNIGVAFSGGIDSSLLAFVIRKYNSNVENIDLMYSGCVDTYDFYGSQKSADLLNLQLKYCILTRENILGYVGKLKKILKTDNLIEISYLIPLCAVLENSNSRTIISGQGADELFMGYHKFGEDLVNAQELSNKLYSCLRQTVKVREEKIAQSFAKALIMPYLDYKIGEVVLPLETVKKNDGKNVKIVLREVARYLGLPEEIVNKKKKAAQYGSGVWKIVKKYNDENLK